MSSIRPILSALIEREWLVIKRGLPEAFGDGVTALSLHIIMLKFFLPALGMATTWQLPLYLGNIMMLSFSVGYQRGMQITFDISTRNSAGYYFTLPISFWWVILIHVGGAVVTLCTLLLPMGCVGMYLLQGGMPIAGTLWQTVLMAMLVMFFFSLLFTMLGIRFTPEKYMDHMWPRVLGPMWTFGTMLFTWQRIYSFSPNLSYLFLCSPVTYCVEGLRRAVLGDPQFMSVTYCASVVAVCCLVLTILLCAGVRRRLDPVQGAVRRRA
ncbi:MAG: hypothetical protein PVJ92_03390 [Candidatus Dependentiae bacterium]